MHVRFLLKYLKRNLQVVTEKNVHTVAVQEKMVVVHTVAENANLMVAVLVKVAKEDLTVVAKNALTVARVKVEKENHTVEAKNAAMVNLAVRNRLVETKKVVSVETVSTRTK